MAASGSQGWCLSRVRARCFKSFGAAWEEVRLQPGLTGLTGPNGCGKSTLLQAILFAVGCSAAQLSAKSFQELKNTSHKDQVCEVELQFSCGSALASAGRRAQHKTQDITVAASLAPDGSRVFTVDGKSKTGVQVKALLRSLGVHLDSAMAFIRQASVTHLADTNTVEGIGTVLNVATGMARWQEETAKARTELHAAHTALNDITNNVKQLERIIGHDDERLQQVERLQQLRTQEVQLARRLCAALASQKADTDSRLADTRRQVEQLQGLIHDQEAKAESVKQDMHAAQTQLASLAKAGDNSDEMLALLAVCETLKEQVAALQQYVESAQANTEQHERLLREESALEAKRAAADQALRASESRHQALADSLHDDTHDTDNNNSTGVQTRRLQQLLSSSRSHAEALGGEHRQLQARRAAIAEELEETRQEQTRLQDALTDLQPADTATHASHVSDAPQPTEPQLREHSADIQAELSTLTVRVRVLEMQLGIHSNQWAAHTQPPPLPSPLQTLIRFRPQQPSTGQGKDTTHAGKQAGQSWLQGFAPEAGGSMRSRGNTGARQGAAGFDGAATGDGKGGGMSVGNGTSVSHQGAVANWLRALSVVAGGSLQVVVTNTLQQATAVLERPAHQGCGGGPHGGLVRAWPLDRITYKDFTQRQRQAQQALGADKVVLPLDLLDYHPSVHKAVARAFGGYVLAADSETAAVLAQRYGLSSVTPDGTVSRRGSVSGGYTDDRQRVSGPEATLRNVLELQQTLARKDDLRQELVACEAQLTALDTQRRRAAAVEHTTHELGHAADSVSRLQQDLCTLDTDIQRSEQLLKDARKEEARYQELLSTAARGAQSDAAAAQAAHKLREQQRLQLAAAHTQLERDRAAAAAATSQLGAVRCHLLQLRMQQAALLAAATDNTETHSTGSTAAADAPTEPQYHEPTHKQSRRTKAALNSKQGRKGRTSDPGSLHGGGAVQHSRKPDKQASDGSTERDIWDIEPLRALHGKAQQQLAEAQTKLDTARQATAETERLRPEIQKRIEDGVRTLRELKNTTQSTRRQLGHLQEQVSRYQRSAQELDKRLSSIRGDYGLRHANTDNPAHTSDTSHTKDQTNAVTDLEKQLKQLTTAKKSLSGTEALTATEELAAKSRRQDVKTFQEQMQALAAAAAALEQGIQTSHEHVLATHRRIQRAICTRFEELCSALLPTLDLTLGPTHHDTCGNDNTGTDKGANAGGPGASGRPHGGNAGDKGAGLVILFRRGHKDAWCDNLEQLSGGQRTLVSLALLLAAALEGSGSSVVLLDEVDAALDEANQAAAASLLRALAHGALTEPETQQTDSSQRPRVASVTAPVPRSNKRKLVETKQGAGAACRRVQVLCVTHHSAFTEVCDTLVQVSRTAEGTTFGKPLVTAGRARGNAALPPLHRKT